MNKEYLVNKRICFFVMNHNESEYIQEYLFGLGFAWFSTLNVKKVKMLNYPILIFTEYDNDLFGVENYYLSTSKLSDITNQNNTYTNPSNSINIMFCGVKYKLLKCNNFIRKIKLKSLKG